ncbi:MAG: acetyltransferase [Lachnospiraceae bacterium]|nr:acetyltransferase [Lachnospiraceae bacterium]
MVLGIYGASGLGREVEIIARKINKIENRWERIVYVDDNESITEVLGVSSYTFKKAIEVFPDIEISIAIGEPSTREKVYLKVKDAGIKLATLIHPGVYIDESSKIGDGVTICEGVTTTSCVNLGDNVYIQPHAVIGHDISIGRHSVVGSNVEIGGSNRIGERVFIGFMVGTLQGLEIGDDVEISAGSIVFRNIEPGMIVMGNPARVIRRNEGRGVFGKHQE